MAGAYQGWCDLDGAKSSSSSPSRRRPSTVEAAQHGLSGTTAAAKMYRLPQVGSAAPPSASLLDEDKKRKYEPTQLLKRQRRNHPHEQGMDSSSMGEEEEKSVIKQSASDIPIPDLSNTEDILGGGGCSTSSSSGGENGHADSDLGGKRKRQDELINKSDIEEVASRDGVRVGTAGEPPCNGSVPPETASASGDSNYGESSNAHGSMNGSNIKTMYPIQQRLLRLERVRQRFFGINLEKAHELITVCFCDRLDVKSKQNSSLLHCLPSFTSIPGVRCLIAANLEKWLQSPALAGLARTLFSSTVNNMKNVDPPLPEDLQAIDSFIGMRLKANQVTTVARLVRYFCADTQCLTSLFLITVLPLQLNVHIANITAIAKRIPVASVANHIYSKLLFELVNQNNVSAGMNTDQLKMIGAIHRAISPQVSYDALAAALLVLLVTPAGDAVLVTPRTDRDHLIKKLRSIIRALASHLGPSFLGCLLVDALLSFDVKTDSWSAQDEEDKARLMFQCVTISVSPFVESQANGSMLSENDVFSLKESLNAARKLVLTWCCIEYGPHYSSKGQLKLHDYFCSVLGPRSKGEEIIPPWLNTMRCLLFLEGAESPQIKQFMIPGGASAGDDADWEEELPRIRLCCEYGGDLHNDLAWIVLKSTSIPQGIDSEMSIQLLEHLFQNCGRNRQGSSIVSDPHLVWELYNLVKYTPDSIVASLHAGHAAGDDSLLDEALSNGKDPQVVPR